MPATGTISGFDPEHWTELTPAAKPHRALCGYFLFIIAMIPIYLGTYRNHASEAPVPIIRQF
jgi:hypothetical protein